MSATPVAGGGMRLAIRVGFSVLAAAAAVCGAGAEEEGAPVIPAAAAAQVFREARELCGAEHGRLWGHSLCGPMLLVDGATRQAVLDRRAAGAVQDGAVFRLTLPPEAGVANTAVELDGERWTMLLWPLPQEPDARHVLLMHESFHRIQPAIGLPASGGLADNAHLDTRAGRTWLRGELYALAAALGSGGEERRRALVDALVPR